MGPRVKPNFNYNYPLHAPHIYSAPAPAPAPAPVSAPVGPAPTSHTFAAPAKVPVTRVPYSVAPQAPIARTVSVAPVAPLAPVAPVAKLAQVAPVSPVSGAHSVAAVGDVTHLEASLTSSQYHAQDEEGNYSFGYTNPTSARQETGNPLTGIRGSYSDGHSTYHYVADAQGFGHV